MKKHRLEIVVVTWTIFWAIVAGVWNGTTAHAATPKVDCYVTAWPPHQVPGPAVEFDGEWNCLAYQFGQLTVLGFKDGALVTDTDSIVCGGTHCGDSKTVTKSWGCHNYQEESIATWGSLTLKSTSGIWRGCR